MTQHDQETRPQPRRRRPRRSLEGMTLIEIMIVVIIMAMIATAVTLAVVPQMKKAKIKDAQTNASTIRAAVTSYMLSEGTQNCPTVEELVEAGEITRHGRHVDPWDHDFQIECDGDDVNVISAGPDGQFGSEDDIQ